MQGARSSILPKIWSQASGEERNNCAESKLAHRIQLRLEFSKLASTTAEDCVGHSSDLCTDNIIVNDKTRKKQYRFFENHTRMFQGRGLKSNTTQE